ncbi:helix-turn-helix domain-containing protein [Hymenobacter negativus]|uniref:Helix-turn-helix transcriptional regulator n=1 Tax=Hymenobacter negativus TaxID=2795026 RepID=A0ABS3QLN1_9BACT|nr:AraC family transcriptional regulator [Hymenobacter negativus]MBO2012122.1 helix-turn-helix transcriptional regulator [Hymenobacter negativus]
MLTNSVSPVLLRSGTPLFELREFGADTSYTQWQQLPTYSVLWIQQGQGCYDDALSTSPFAVQTLLFFAANQPFRLCFELGTDVRGVALHFGADFYCLERHQAETTNNRVLFNVLAEPVAVQLGTRDQATFASVVDLLRREIAQPALAQQELLASCLKILLIQASRLRLEQAEASPTSAAPDRVPSVLRQLEQLIEQHYHQKHSPADYADLLHLTPKTLGKLTRTYFRRTLTELIQARIVVEAKRELYLTTKSIKEIAFALGFSDQYYFSRFFKHITRVAPQEYRRATSSEREALLTN